MNNLITEIKWGCVRFICIFICPLIFVCVCDVQLTFSIQKHSHFNFKYYVFYSFQNIDPVSPMCMYMCLTLLMSPLHFSNKRFISIHLSDRPSTALRYTLNSPFNSSQSKQVMSQDKQKKMADNESEIEKQSLPQVNS